MNVVIAIEEIIKANEKRIKTLKSQLNNHEAGIEKLTVFAVVSAEKALDEAKESLEKNKQIYNELLKHDLKDIEKEARVKEAVTRKNYFKYQKVRIKRNKTKSNNQKLEAMMIIDELPSTLQLADEDIFNVASLIIKLDLRVHDELEDQLNEIKKDFDTLLEDIEHEGIAKLGMLHTHIPIIVLHLTILVANIKEDIESENLTCFRGLPRFEDWWIDELWKNHQAYFALYKWKDIVSFLCLTKEQKQAWEHIFSNWVFAKQALNKKGKLAYGFNYAFDTLIKKYTELDEELNTEHLKQMDSIVNNICAKEDLSKYKHPHNIRTDYFKFKRDKIKE